MTDDSDSDSIIGNTINNQGCAFRPSLPRESDSASAHRPGSESGIKQHQDENVKRAQWPLEPLLPENATGVDRSAQGPPEIVG